MANIPFTELEFAADGAPAERTMPDRLAEIFNVKDYGALGDGSTDDRAEIQAAIDAASAVGGGTIYFPPSTGTYPVGTPGLTLNAAAPLSLVFKGSGHASRVAGNGNYYVFTRSLGTAVNEASIVFDTMRVTNSGATGGCFRIGSAKSVVFRDGHFGGHNTYTPENTNGGLASTNTMFSACVLAPEGTVTGSIGIIIAGGVIEGTDVRGYDVGYRISGNGTTIWGGRSERCNTSMEFGVGNAGEARAAGTDIGAKGVAVIGHTFEGHWVTMHFDGTTEGFFGSGLYMLGHSAANAGATGSISATQTGIWIGADKLKAAYFNGVTIGSTHETAAVILEDPTSRPYITFNNVNVTLAGVGWSLSTKAMAARYLNCSDVDTEQVFLFANLPGSSDRQEGDEFIISDGSTAVWGDTVSGGGANRVLVRFNGTNWTVVGK